MKKSLYLIAIVFLFSFTSPVLAQVTLLSNNTDLSTGIALNGKGLLISDSDSLWVTSGTAGTTTKLINTVSFVDSTGGALFAGKVFFAGSNSANGAELWVTDATGAGTTIIKDINPGAGNSIPNNFIVYNNALYFTADNGSQGFELWTSNGTTAGTVMLKDINPGAGSSFINNFTNGPMFYINNGLLYFNASDGTTGKELWRTNGTAAGTVLVKDITPGTAGTTFTTITSLGTNFIFGVRSGSGFASAYQLWKSDGTTAGTTILKDFGSFSGLFTPFFFTFNNKLYFNGTDYTNTGTELWVTDGTAAGTVLLKDIYPGSSSSSPFLYYAVIIGNKFYFEAANDTNGSELWMSDGTAAGTQLLKDINPGAAGSDANIFKNLDYSTPVVTDGGLYNGKFFFSADDGTHGTELWITDGTSAGTVLVKDILPGSSGALNYDYIYTTSGLFFSADDGTSGTEPWLSNGTAAGTTRIADVNPGAGSSLPYALFFYNNQLYFNATNGDDANHTDLFKVNANLLPLPVSLLSFSATVQPANAVKLNWTTTNEINSSYFVIERSTDGNHFKDIAHISSTGNSAVNQNYSLTDPEAGNLNSNVIYYRLKMIDKDGLYQYSKILLLHLKGSSLQFSFSPNPVKNQLNVMITPGGAKQVALQINDASGKQVYQQTIAAGQAVSQQYINVAGWQKGIYYIRLIADGLTNSDKFIIQ